MPLRAKREPKEALKCLLWSHLEPKWSEKVAKVLLKGGMSGKVDIAKNDETSSVLFFVFEGWSLSGGCQDRSQNPLFDFSHHFRVPNPSFERPGGSKVALERAL